MSERLEEFCVIYNALKSEKREWPNARILNTGAVYYVSIPNMVHIGTRENNRLHASFSRNVQESFQDMIFLIITYLHENATKTDVEFIKFLYQCICEFTDLTVRFYNQEMFIWANSMVYFWKFNDDNTIVNIEITKTDPPTIIRISELCAEYNKNRKEGITRQHRINNLELCLNNAFTDDIPYYCKQIENNTKLLVYRLDSRETRICEIILNTKHKWGITRKVSDIDHGVLNIMALCIMYEEANLDCNDIEGIKKACGLLTEKQEEIDNSTPIQRVDNAIEQAIYDLLKVKPVDVDAIVKLRSLLK